jgi:hypothetical protein
VLEHGADYLLTVKDNQSTIHRTLEKLIDKPPEIFSLQDPPPVGMKKKPPVHASTAAREPKWPAAAS